MDTGSFFPLLLGSLLFLLSFLLRLGTAITLIDLLCLLKFLWFPTSSILLSNWRFLHVCSAQLLFPVMMCAVNLGFSVCLLSFVSRLVAEIFLRVSFLFVSFSICITGFLQCLLLSLSFSYFCPFGSDYYFSRLITCSLHPVFFCTLRSNSLYLV